MKQKILFPVVIQGVMVAIVLLLSGCWWGANEKKTGLVVVNVLDKKFYDDCHIKDSICIPFEMTEQCVDTIDKNAEVVLYCSNYQCTSSEYVAQQLLKKGFSNLCVYEGGMAEWYQQGLPVEGPHKQAYLSKPCRKLSYDEQSNIRVITANELAQKMNVCPMK